MKIQQLENCYLPLQQTGCVVVVHPSKHSHFSFPLTELTIERTSSVSSMSIINSEQEMKVNEWIAVKENNEDENRKIIAKEINLMFVVLVSFKK